MIQSHKININLFAFVLITLTLYVFWGNAYTFFWRDEWELLSTLRNTDFNFFFKPHYGHILPVFKLFYYLEVQSFGINTVFYSITNLFIYSLALFFTFQLALESTPDKSEIQPKRIALGFTLLLVIHPINFNHLLWSFQTSQSLYILFQVLCILFFVKFVRSESRKDLLYSILFLLVQNYSFGNGLFLPFVFMGYIIFFIKENKLKILILYLFIFIITIVIQAILGNPEGLAKNAIINWQQVLLGFLQFLDLNLCRIFSVTDILHNQFYFLGLLLFSALILYGYLQKNINKPLLTLYLFWFLINCISIPIVRQNSGKFPHYYTVMSLIPVLFVSYIILFEKIESAFNLRKKISLFALALATLSIYMIDTRMVAIFSKRNALNEEALKESIRHNTTYFAYDDPYFNENGANRIEGVKEVYLYWKSRTPFLLVPPEK